MTFHRPATKHSTTAQWAPAHTLNAQQMLEHAAARGYTRTISGKVVQLVRWSPTARKIMVRDDHDTTISIPKTQCADVWTETVKTTP